MAKDTTPSKKDVNSKVKNQPLFVVILKLPLKILLFLLVGFIVATIMSIIIEFFGLAFIWTDNPNHAKEMFLTEYSYIKKYHTGEIGNWKPIDLMQKTLQDTYLFFQNGPIFNFISNWWSQVPTSSFGALLKNGFPKLGYYAQSIIYIVMTIAMRISIFVLSSGWFVLCGILGLIHGLIQREIRKAEGGLEHSFVFHFAKSHLSLPLQLGWLLYLSSPWAIYPSIVIVPAGLLFGYLVALTAATFKKYL